MFAAAQRFDETGYEMWRRPFLTICISAVLAIPAMAFERPFPAPTKRGKLAPGAYPEITIDGTLRRLAPGARIWNESNLIEMPAALRGSDLVVNYTEDSHGEIDRVWILTPEEAREPVAKQINPLQR
ncbi:hypothetical protein [Noviherbaspirillum denitrificans]|nr:hypothetical protein [Noviherbaspirillum denitrificans]